jgi:microcystin degradation protein MlrC
MHKSLCLAGLLAVLSLAGAAAQKPRIAIAGLAIESSTFSPATTDEAAFHASTGQAILDNYPFFKGAGSLRDRAVWSGTLQGHALPGGAVTREAYESMMRKTLDGLRAQLPLDGLFFDIHGAMSVVGMEDAEGDMIARIRAVVGPKTLISTSMDLHGNVSWRLAAESDLITCYRMAPHEDAMESKQRAVENLLARLESGKGRPAYKAHIAVPVLLPGEKTSTRIEPAKSIYAAIPAITKRPGIVDAAIWIGYAWADEPRNHAAVMVTGDDQAAVKAAAESLAASFWAARKKFEFVAPTLPYEQAMERALTSTKRPFFLSDMGDNPTAGGAGDVTWTLARLLERKEFQRADGPSLIYASIPGPELVAQAVRAGVGGTVDGTAGAAVDHRYAPPVRIAGKVTAIRHGDKDAETEVVVKTGSVSVIVTKKRKPYHYEADFTRLDLEPRKADIVVVKIGYLQPELYDMRADWVMALTPGGVDQDLERLPYTRIQRPMFPLDEDMKDPDLSAKWVPLSDQFK